MAQVDITIIIKELIDEIAKYDTATGSTSNGVTAAASPATAAGNATETTGLIISEVSEQIRAIDDVDGEDFLPLAVAIGPCHRDQDSADAVEMKKLLLHRVLPAGHGRADEVTRYVDEMKGLVSRVQQCYPRAEETANQVEPMARTLLLDGLFIVSWFVLGTGKGVTTETADCRWSLTEATVIRDVFYLLENQLPFFVLERIYELVRGGDSAAVVTGVNKCVGKLVRDLGYAGEVVLGNRRPFHILHLLHMHFRPVALDQRQRRRDGDGQIANGEQSGQSSQRDGVLQRLYNTCFFSRRDKQPQSSSTSGAGGGRAVRGNIVSVKRWRAAVYYREHGVRLMARELGGGRHRHGGAGARSILDVELRGDKLLIPCLTIDEETWTMLRNLMAMEQSNPTTMGCYVTAYCVFMSQLASRDKDVELLSAKGIISHFLGSDEELAAGFRQLCNGVVLDISDPTDLNYLSSTWGKLEDICRSGHRRSMAWMRQRQCNNYAMTVALLAAVIAFVCTVVQALFAVLSYKKQLEQ